MNPLLRKLTSLRYLYGGVAADYFISNPACEDCEEKRIAVLNIHHIHGKSVDEFKTLCFNCHMLEHCQTPDYTFSDYERFIEERTAIKESLDTKRSDRLERMKILSSDGKSLREIGKEVGLSHVAVKRYLDAPLGSSVLWN